MKDPTIIKSEIFSIIASHVADKSITIKNETPLIGSGLIDSMKLVELCLALEEKATELKFEFDWTSAAAMSKSRGMFRTVGSLLQEFVSQLKAKK